MLGRDMLKIKSKEKCGRHDQKRNDEEKCGRVRLKRTSEETFWKYMLKRNPDEIFERDTRNIKSEKKIGRIILKINADNQF